VQQPEINRGFHLFVMNELFKGTNMMERIEGERGVGNGVLDLLLLKGILAKQLFPFWGMIKLGCIELLTR
jgi:hypothetical protein